MITAARKIRRTFFLFSVLGNGKNEKNDVGCKSDESRDAGRNVEWWVDTEWKIEKMQVRHDGNLSCESDCNVCQSERGGRLKARALQKQKGPVLRTVRRKKRVNPVNSGAKNKEGADVWKGYLDRKMRE